MRIGLISTAVPLILGGGRFIVDWLHEKLVERGHQVEIIYIPSTEEEGHILPQMTALRMMKLDEYFDRVITFRPPAHVVQHPRKVVWFIHHLRIFYDLWETTYRPFPIHASSLALRASIFAADTQTLNEAHRVFTNSRVVGERIRNFNGLDSEILYPPVLRPDLFRSGDYGEEIVSVCRMEHHKRQHLLVEALGATRTNVRLRLCGASSNPAYASDMLAAAQRMGVADRLTIESRWISEDDKIDRLENALASVYAPFDEDSYGYPTLEAAHAQRCTVTTTDSGGVPEFVEHGVNGFIAEPNAEALAAEFDKLYENRALARSMGLAAQQRVADLGINWDTVVARLLA